MSDTPRTDHAEYLSYDSEPPESLEMVDVAFARQLERELNAANERIKRLEELLWLSQPMCESKEAKL